MVGLVIAAHGHLAEELVATAEQIVGTLTLTATCSIEPGASPEVIREQMRRAVSAVDTGDGVLVLADLFGGTPCNQGLTLTREHRLEVLTGVNLPMVLKANSLRAEALTLPELATALTRYGQKNITCASALLRESQALRNH
ncbi:MAG TPA: PTS sugar transporter subunit IIA [Myxococcaceae bacterium]|jgi:PTS system mannose-specific IIA component|nr:PTS sugar transporter subunit IIA [Myxococcaceae bacterium]